jgi:endonuclease/exonuclease/phosphatase family metal-dependent hydrolase
MMKSITNMRKSGKSPLRFIAIAVSSLVLPVILPATSSAKSPIDPNEGLPSVNWENAYKVAGRTAYVSGFIIGVGSSKTINFLNFDEERPGKFTGIIRNKYWKNFPRSLKSMYGRKLVRIRGPVTLYRGKPQIQISSPDQIEVIKELPPEDLREFPKRKVGREFTLATYNILNLFDDVDDPYTVDEVMSAKPRKELNTLAKVIRELDADVIAMQEVETRGYLKRFIDVLLPEMGYEHVVHFEGNNPRGIDVCLISRIPIGPVTSYRHVKFPSVDNTMRSFERDVLTVTLEPKGGKPFEIWVVHLKSNYGGREHAEPIRMGEAKEIRRMLDERLKKKSSARIILCGDFNDTWDSDTLKTIVGEGSNAMTTFFEELSEPQRISYNKGEHRSMIDFILCSPAMAKKYVPGSFSIRPGTVKNSGSDHNPVMARFKIK